jgi:serine/threonine-protein kinase
VDPGQHTVRVEADGHQPWSQTVAVEPATRHDIHVPRLQPTAAELTVASTPPVEESVIAVPAAPQPTNYQRVAGYIVGGAGVVGLGVATYFGLRSLHFLSERDKLCPDGTCALPAPQADATELADARARDFSVAFNWTAALSAVAVGAGVALVLTAPRERRVELSMGWGSLQLRGQLPE